MIQEQEDRGHIAIMAARAAVVFVIFLAASGLGLYLFHSHTANLPPRTTRQSAAAWPPLRAHSFPARPASVAIRSRAPGILDTGQPVEQVAFSPNGQMLAACSNSDLSAESVLKSRLQIWNVAAKSIIATRSTPGCTSVAWSPDGCAVEASSNAGVLLWMPADGTAVTWLGRSGSDAVFSPDGKVVAVQVLGNNLYNIQFWDISARTLSRTIAIPFGNLRSVSFSPDSKILAVSGSIANADGMGGRAVTGLWNVATGANIKVIQGHLLYQGPGSMGGDNNALSVAFSPDGKSMAMAMDFVAVGTYPTGIELFDVATGQETEVVSTTGGNSVAFSPDGKVLAFVDELGKTVQLWNVASHKIIATLTLADTGNPSLFNEFSGLAFSPNGGILAVPAGNDIELWPAG
jgi:WD40 repeat protein